MPNKKDVEYIVSDYVNKRSSYRNNEVYLVKDDYGVCIDKNSKYIHIFKMYVDSRGAFVKGVDFNVIQVNANFKKSFWDNKPNTQLKKVKGYIDSRFRGVRDTRV